MKLLHVDASILGDHSASRQLSAAIVKRLIAINPATEVIRYDLAAEPIGHLTGGEFLAFRGAEPEDEATRQNALRNTRALDDFLAADVIVIGAPMYNFSIPTQLRGWIDHLVVPGKTFAYTQAGLQGLVAGKRIIVVSTRGSLYAEDAARSEQDHQEAYLRTTFGNLGVTDFAFIRAEGVGLGETQKNEALAAARRDIAALAAA